jgi:Holliday junction resolvase RusA-like endonuclease
MKIEQIKMPYIGELSVNHRLGRRKGGGYYLKEEVRNWNEEFGWLIKHLHLEDWKLPLHVKCDGVFKDARSTPDLNNMIKCLDVIEDVTGINDVNMRWQDGKVTIKDNETPYLLFTITEASNEEHFETALKRAAVASKRKSQGKIHGG